ncbi:MAG: VCBS repeat-containing protein [Planctomycetes bacterium]|nr:VCBS repeat-containing protein [Planctomycetota bacterium]
MKTSRTAILLTVAALAGCARHSADLAGGLQAGKSPRFETRSEVKTNSAHHADFYVADLNGDNVLDMAVISITGELRVLIGNGTTFTVGQETQLGGGPIWIAGGDFDGDNDRDLVIVRSTANTSDVWLNDGTGTFTPGPVLPLPQEPLAVVVGDLNGDTFLDIVVTVPQQPEMRIFYGNGAGAFPITQELGIPGGGGQPGYRTFNVQIGDVTRDGIVDLMALDPASDRLIIWPGVAGGQPGATYCELQIPGAPAAIALGDLSGDGLVDMCVTTFDSNRFVVITDILPPVKGGGDDGTDGTIGPVGQVCDYLSFEIPAPDMPSLATIADVTGDGLVDLVACLAFRDSLFVVPQLPGGGVGAPSLYDATGNPLRPFIGDFDGNGRNDVFALSGNDDRINLWLADDGGRLLGARNFDSGLTGASWMVGGDFDGDGDREVIVGSDAGTSLSVMGRGPDFSLGVEATFDIGSVVRQLDVADLDGDDRPDLIVGVDGGLKLLRNVSTGTGYAFATPAGTPAIVGSGIYPFGAAAADLDRDGDMDIVWCDFVGGSLHLLPGTPTPFVFGPEQIVDLGPTSGPIDVVAADFTGDGRQDLAISRSNQADILILRNDGGNVFTQFLNVPVGTSPNYLITADFNGDGRADLVVSNGASGTVSVLFGSPSGFFGQSFPAGSIPTALLAQDLSGDGLPDILVASGDSSDFRVLVGNGSGGFPELSTFPGAGGASNAVLQDMNSDGRLDLMISSLETQRVSLVRNVTESTLP